MADTHYTFKHLLRQIFDTVLILAGICFLINAVNFSPTHVWFALLLIIMGIFVLSTPAQQGGVVVILLGLYLLLRTTGIIALPWLRYLLGASFVFIGAADIIRGTRRGHAPT